MVKSEKRLVPYQASLVLPLLLSGAGAGVQPADTTCQSKTHPTQVLTGLRPSPTSHAFVGFRFSGRLTQGPAVRAADRRHPLRLDMSTSTRSAYVQVRCAVFALWSEHHSGYAHQIRPANTKLDSFLPTLLDF
jgi:hypothetical protein